jgi:hypothetical protein
MPWLKQLSAISFQLKTGKFFLADSQQVPAFHWHKFFNLH